MMIGAMKTQWTKSEMSEIMTKDAISWPGDSATPDWKGEKLIPSRIVVETVFGCNAKCSMCLIDHPTERAKGVMSIENFKSLVDALTPYRDHITKFDLFGLGEPLLDKYLIERIIYLKDRKFTGLALSTNAHLLNDAWQTGLLETGIETILFSIDGILKETHEAVRPRVNYDRILKNVIGMIEKRDSGNFNTRFIIRFVHQPSNTDQWDEYRAFWKSVISKAKGDLILRYDIHDWSGQVNAEHTMDTPPKTKPCHHLFEKMVILANGKLALCFEDILEGKYGFGNAFEEDPIELFNSKGLNKLRKVHLAGKKGGHKMCGKCTVLETEANRLKG